MKDYDCLQVLAYSAVDRGFCDRIELRCEPMYCKVENNKPRGLGSVVLDVPWTVLAMDGRESRIWFDDQLQAAINPLAIGL